LYVQRCLDILKIHFFKRIPDFLHPKDIEQQESNVKSGMMAQLNWPKKRPAASFHPPPPTQENNPLVKETRNRLIGLAKEMEELDLIT
jgi:hypothetical protein